MCKWSRKYKNLTSEKESQMKHNMSLINIFVVVVLLMPMQNSYSQEKVYGWEMMSAQERIQHQETLRKLKTAEEKERYRIEHHKRMEERAKEKGVSLPDMPMNQRQNNSPMPGGQGMGSGSGMGKGR